jgi:hypothetical protein
MSESSNSGKGSRPHKAGGKTFKSRRMKMAMERESNAQIAERFKKHSSGMVLIGELFRPKPKEARHD